MVVPIAVIGKCWRDIMIWLQLTRNLSWSGTITLMKENQRRYRGYPNIRFGEKVLVVIKWKDKVFSRAVEGARCIYCEKKFVQVLPRLLVMVYAKQCGTKVSINDEKTIGILLDVLLPEVNLAFTFPSRETDRGAKVIEVMQYMCAARKIQLIEVRKKEPIELAHEIKQAFAKAHLYIDSDSEKEIDYLRKWYFHQTV